MNKDLNKLPHDELLQKYQDALQEIQYLEYRVRSLDEQLDIWQQAWEDQLDLLISHDLI